MGEIFNGGIEFEIYKVEKSIFDQYYVYPTLKAAIGFEKSIGRKCFDEFRDSITVCGNNFIGDKKPGEYILKYIFEPCGKLDVEGFLLIPLEQFEKEYKKKDGD